MNIKTQKTPPKDFYFYEHTSQKKKIFYICYYHQIIYIQPSHFNIKEKHNSWYGSDYWVMLYTPPQGSIRLLFHTDLPDFIFSFLDI